MARKKRAGGRRPPPQLTSHPTGRAAYADTRRWLIDRHGPVCAYCARKYPEKEMTLDHVAPRRGQSAYDRRDNLVLACKPCNAAKADMPLLAFLFRQKSRAANLARYGDHLSVGLRELIGQLAGEGAPVIDPDSPYLDVIYKEPSRPIPTATFDEDDESPYAD